MAVSSLRSVIDELRTTDFGTMSDQQVEDGLVEIIGVAESLEAEKLRWLAEMDRRRSFTKQGSLSAASWLATTAGMGSATAREKLQVARGLEAMPQTKAAFSAGEISYSQARMLAQAAEAHPEAFSTKEDELLEAARDLPVGDLGRTLDTWRQSLDAGAALAEAEARYQRRRLRTSRTVLGMVRVEGELDPEGGEALLTALRAVTEVPGLREERTAEQRRADALVDLARHYLDHGQAHGNGGERPHVVVTVDLASLEGRAGRRCDLDQAGVIHPEAARRLACDAGVSRVITTGASEPLDVGRRTRTVPASLRRALVVRDGGCRFPGCDRPHWWCDAHHVIHWLDEGPTSLANLVLLCRRHHRLVHEGGFHLERMEGELRFRRPDWSLIPDRSPPARM
ncbi:MAG: DUF222 domain-containing protein, partial [Acidimicrobiia bacterium]